MPVKRHFPEVFHVTDDTCYIKADVRLDGGYDRNEGKAGLKPETISQFQDDIFDAADGCPVDVIIVVEGGEAEATVEEEVPAVVEVVPEPAVEETVEVVGDDLGTTSECWRSKSSDSIRFSIRKLRSLGC